MSKAYTGRPDVATEKDNGRELKRDNEREKQRGERGRVRDIKEKKRVVRVVGDRSLTHYPRGGKTFLL